MTNRSADEPDDALPRAARVAIAVAAAASLALAIAAFHHVELSGGARLDGAAAFYAASSDLGRLVLDDAPHGAARAAAPASPPS